MFFGVERKVFISRIFYAFGALSPAISQTILLYFQLVFFYNVVEMDPVIAGTLVFVLQITDALFDPLVGFLSDNFFTIWGRRKPWIFFGVLPTLVFWVLIWSNWPFLRGNQIISFFYFLIVGIFYNFSSSCLATPYYSLIYDMTTSYEERTFVSHVQQFFYQLGMMFALFGESQLITTLMPPSYSDRGTGYAFPLSAITFSFFLAMPYIVSLFFSEERPIDEDDHLNIKLTYSSKARTVFFNIIDCVKCTFTSRNYSIIYFVHICMMIASYFFASNFLIYTIYVIDLADHANTILLAMQLSSLFSIFVWNYFGRKLGKKTTLFIGIVIWFIASLLNFFLTEKLIILVYALAILRGFGCSVAVMIPLSMLTDSIAYDEVQEIRSGKEATFYSLFLAFGKLALALSGSVSAITLWLCGYQVPDRANPSETNQNDQVITALKFFVSVIPCLFLILAVIPLYYYPITKKERESVKIYYFE